MILELLQLNINKVIGIIILIIIAFIFIKTLIEEIVKLGFRGLFIGLPKAFLNVILILPKLILSILKFIFDFIKRFIKALKICIFGV